MVIERSRSFRAVTGLAGDLEPLVRAEDRLERLGEHAMVIRDQNADLLRQIVDGGLQGFLPAHSDLLR